MSGKREWRRILVTRRQAAEMADAIFYLQQRAELFAEVAGVQNKPTVAGRVALHSLRVRLYAAAAGDGEYRSAELRRSDEEGRALVADGTRARPKQGELG